MQLDNTQPSPVKHPQPSTPVILRPPPRHQTFSDELRQAAFERWVVADHQRQERRRWRARLIRDGMVYGAVILNIFGLLQILGAMACR